MSIGSRQRALLLAAVSMAFIFTPSYSQPAEDKAPSKTKLEAFQRQTGSVLIKGYSDIGSIASASPSTAVLEVRSTEFINAASKQKQTGVVIETTSFTSRMDVSGSSSAFIDFDEIDNLLKGLDYVSQANSDVTKHKNFEVRYETRGGFAVIVFNDSKSNILASIEIGARSIHVPIAKLQDFRAMVLQAKERLDALR